MLLNLHQYLKNIMLHNINGFCKTALLSSVSLPFYRYSTHNIRINQAKKKNPKTKQWNRKINLPSVPDWWRCCLQSNNTTWSRSPSALHRSWPGGPWECVASASVSGPLSPDQLWSAKTQEEVSALTLMASHTYQHKHTSLNSGLNNGQQCVLLELMLLNNVCARRQARTGQERFLMSVMTLLPWYLDLHWGEFAAFCYS